MTKFLSRMAVLAVAISAFASTQAQALTLADLTVPGATIQVGDKLFSDFVYAPTGDMPPAAGVTVTGIINGSNVGLKFTGAFIDIPPPSSDALLQYKVTVLTPGVFITDWHLTGNPDIVPAGGTGSVTITDTFFAADGVTPLLFQAPNGTNKLSIFDINFPPIVAFDPSDSGFFVTPVTSLIVQKDILIASVTGLGTLSFVDQVASQSIPEPTTMVMAGLALPMLLMVVRRKKS